MFPDSGRLDDWAFRDRCLLGQDWEPVFEVAVHRSGVLHFGSCHLSLILRLGSDCLVLAHSLARAGAWALLALQ
eukprot:757312-Alexandrium_andersonii.AAC.1